VVPLLSTASVSKVPPPRWFREHITTDQWRFQRVPACGPRYSGKPGNGGIISLALCYARGPDMTNVHKMAKCGRNLGGSLWRAWAGS
jgi:hypothetical protein